MKFILPALSLALVPFAVEAQSAEGLGASPAPPGEAPAAQQAAETAPSPVAEPSAAAAPVSLEPSRYAGIDTPAYVEMMLARLSIQSRKTDPFGRFQDPEVRAPERKFTPNTPTRQFAPEPPTPFADVIAALEITTIHPSRETFLIGGRSFRTGNILQLQLPNGKAVRAQVLAVRGSGIDFYNPDTKDRATYRMNALPSGMVRSTDDRNLPPGVQGDGASEPVRIQLNIPLSGPP